MGTHLFGVNWGQVRLEEAQKTTKLQISFALFHTSFFCQIYSWERKLAHSLIRRNLLVAQVSWNYFLISGKTFPSRSGYNKLFLLTKKCPHLIGIFQFNLIVRMLILSDIWLGALFNLNLSCHLSSESGFHLIIPLLVKLCSDLW